MSVLLLDRLASVEQVSQLSALQTACFNPPWSDNQIQQQIEHPRSLNYLLTEHQEVQGYCFYQVLFEQVELLQIAIHPSQRNLGCAARLLNQSINLIQATEPEIEKIILEVRASNDPAIKLYKNAGFEFDGERPNYYPSLINDGVREHAKLYSFNIANNVVSM